MKLLIPLAYINEACFLSLNIDEKKIKIGLIKAQKTLKNDLGGEFYAQIETQYEPANDTFTSANATLYEDYIKDYLAWNAYLTFLGFSQSDSTPTGERSFNDESSALLSDIALAKKEKNVKEMAAFYKNELINYLELEQSKDSTAFPLWKGCKKGSFSWGISGVERDSDGDKVYSINKAITDNQ
jgi:hypothetical protein